jgi:hypothetical protein
MVCRRMRAAAWLLLLAGGVLPVLAGGVPLPAWSTGRVSRAMCQGSRLRLVATGEVAVAYERAFEKLMHTNILMDVQAVYHSELKPGEKTNLVITALGRSGHYYVDWKDERADVEDVWRATDTNSFFEGGFVITGERYFGDFETVLNVRVQRLAGGNAGFCADVQIYPHNGLIRFIFNNLLSVEDYFRDTMVEMSAEIRRVCTALCRPPPGS